MSNLAEIGMELCQWNINCFTTASLCMSQNENELPDIASFKRDAFSVSVLTVRFQSMCRSAKWPDKTDLNALGDLGDGFTREKSEGRRRWRQSNLTASDVHHCHTLLLHGAAGDEIDDVS